VTLPTSSLQWLVRVNDAALKRLIREIREHRAGADEVARAAKAFQRKDSDQ
jgi:hypothetical protein